MAPESLRRPHPFSAGRRFSSLFCVLMLGALRPALAADTALPAFERADPSLDPKTIALVTQQASTTRRFALAQIGHFQARLQALRDTDGRGCKSGDGKAAAAAPAGATNDPLAKAGLVAQPPQQAQSFDMPVDDCRTLADRRTSLWSAGAVTIGTPRAQAGANAFQFNSTGVTLGGDRTLGPDLAFGGGIGLARDDSDAVPAGGASTGAAGRSAAGYLSYRPIDLLYFEAVVGLGDATIDGARATASGNDALATRRGAQRFVSLVAGSRFASYGWRVLPYTRVDHVRTTLKAATETGAGAESLAYADETIPSWRLVAGATAQTSFATPLGTLAPRTSIEYRRELDRSDSGGLRYADDVTGASYSIVPGAAERDSTTLGLGADLTLPSRWNVGLAGTVNRSSLSSSGRVEARVGRVF